MAAQLSSRGPSSIRPEESFDLPSYTCTVSILRLRINTHSSPTFEHFFFLNSEPKGAENPFDLDKDIPQFSVNARGLFLVKYEVKCNKSGPDQLIQRSPPLVLQLVFIEQQILLNQSSLETHTVSSARRVLSLIT